MTYAETYHMSPQRVLAETPLLWWERWKMWGQATSARELWRRWRAGGVSARNLSKAENDLMQWSMQAEVERKKHNDGKPD